MTSGEFDTLVTILALVPPSNTFEGNEYQEVSKDWAAMKFLETVKDNEMETVKSHDTAFSIARLTFRRSSFQHLSNMRYEIEGTIFEAVGQPIKYGRDLVYVNIRNRDDL